MKKIGMFALLAICLVGLVSATTQSTVSFYQSNGMSTINTMAQVEGNYWDYPNAPVPNTPTANVMTSMSNEGEFGFNQMVTQYGNGQQYPNGAPHEWSMYETQAAWGNGATSFTKTFNIWTVHEGWTSEYDGAGYLDVPEGYDTYNFNGVVTTTAPTNFQHDFNTDNSFETESYVFVNPFED